jgi:hypothetical protein
MGPCGPVTVPPPDGDRRFRRVLAVYRSLRTRQRRLELWLEQRYPKVYDARHAATGIGHALWPLVGPLLAALIVLPIVAVLAALVAVLDLHVPSIDLPSVDLPAIPFPDITAPGWLRAIGSALGAVLSPLAFVGKYVAIAIAVVLGIRRTRQVRRRRTAAEQLGRPELLRRLAIALGGVEAIARARGATTLGEASVREAEAN